MLVQFVGVGNEITTMYWHDTATADRQTASFIASGISQSALWSRD